MIDSPWYPPPSEYYVPADQAHEYPLRQGDLVGPVTVEGTQVPLVQIVHPTCELEKASVGQVQVCIVEELSGLADDFQRGSVTLGMREREGRLQVAFAHTFFLPEVPSGGGYMYTNFRRLHLVGHDHVLPDDRQAALTHDCRVYFIRRWIYFRFRIPLSVAAVRQLEATRIGADKAFRGPLPTWVG